MKVLVGGGTGLVGRALAASLRAAGHGVTVLSRRGGDTPGTARWDPAAGPPDRALLEDADAVVHLAGEPVADRRWSDAQKRRIRDSRVVGTRHLVEGLAAASRRPRVLVCASAVGIYGDRGAEPLEENALPGDDFLARVCVEWEAAALEARKVEVRTVCLRLGVVLSPEGGALAKMLPVFRAGLGGTLGAGTQHFPWVHLQDAVGIATLALDDAGMAGPVNVVGPVPATNAQFTAALGRVLRRPVIMRVPATALRLAMGEASVALLASQRVVPAVATARGYRFAFPDVEGALRNLLDG